MVRTDKMGASGLISTADTYEKREVIGMNHESAELAGKMERCILVVLCVSIMIFNGMEIVHAQLATLNPAANVTDTSAQLSGFVDPNGHDTHWYISVWPGVTYNPSPRFAARGRCLGTQGILQSAVQLRDSPHPQLTPSN